MSDDRDERVDEAIAEYLAACDAGSPPERGTFLAKYPELAASLGEFLEDHARMRAAAGRDPNLTVDSAPNAGADAADRAGSLGSVRYIGDYELLEEIARGGMGVVYRARQVSLNREVALKMILTGQLASAADTARFRAEAEAAANLDHPNILPIYEVGEHQGQQYFAMKLVPDGSLGGKMTELVADSRAAVAVFERVCRAVDYAHKRGILHRDLKPANVLLDANGEPYVTDFGLAKKVGGDSGLTQSGAIVGTPSYMAPEQARAEKQLTTAADVYALGAILYELLTGRPPFRGASVMDTVLQVLEKEPDHPRALNPKADRDLSVIALKCLEKNPGKRYESAGALADDLDRWARGEPVSVSPATRLERAVKWARRKPTLAAAYGLTAVVLVLSGLVAGAALLWQRAESARAQAETARGQAEIARGQAETAQSAAETAQTEAERQKDKFERFDYGRTVQMAHQEWREDNVPATLALFDGTPAHLRGWEWRYVHRLCHSDLLTLKGHTSQVMSATFSPDGSRVLTASSDTTAKVWDAKTGELLLTLKHPGGVRRSGFSPDGTRIVTSCTDNTAKVWDAKTGADLLTLKGHTDVVNSAEFSRDGSRIVTGGSDDTAKVWDAKTGAVLQTFKGHGWVTSASFSADGSRLVTSGHDGNAKVWAAAAGTLLVTLDGGGGQGSSAWFSKDGSKVVTAWGGVWDAKTGAVLPKGSAGPTLSPAFTPDGSRFVAGGDRTAKVCDAKTGTAVLALKGHTAMIWTASFSPDGTRVITGGDDYTAKVWDLKNGAEGLTLPTQWTVNTAAFSPDGSRVVVGGARAGLPSRDGGETWGYTARVCDARTGAELLVLKGHSDDVRSVSFSPDGSRIVTASHDQTAKVWEVPSAKPEGFATKDRAAEVLSLKGHTGQVTSASFSPDGSRIVTGSSDKTAKVWDAKTGAEVLTFKGHTFYVSSASWSPDGSRVVTVGWDRIARIWDARTGAELLTVKWVHLAAAFSPDGTRIVTGGADGPAEVWDATTGAKLLRLKGHTAAVVAVSFSPDGSRIVTGSSDKTAKVWDAKTGAEVLTLKGHTAGVQSVAWSPDGSRIVTCGSYDNRARIWDATPLSREFLPK